MTEKQNSPAWDVYPIKKVYLHDAEKLENFPTIIKCSDFSRLSDLSGYISTASSKFKEEERKSKKEALDIVKRGKKRIEKLSQAGYQDGYKDGRKKAERQIARKITDFNRKTSLYQAQIESDVVELVTKCIKRIVDTFDDKQIVESFVRDALHKFKPNEALVLWVSPSLFEIYSVALCDISRSHALDVKEDTGLTDSQCRLDNGSVVVDGDAYLQIETIRQVLSHSAVFENMGRKVAGLSGKGVDGE